MKIVDIYSEAFKAYGQVIGHDQVGETERQSLMDYLLEETEAPLTGNVYVADEGPIHEMAIAKSIEKVLPYKDIQFGYCHGNSTKVNALEWHRCEELVLAVTDCVLYLGHPDFLMETNGHQNFNTKDLIGVALKAGEILRLAPLVMHFAPTKVKDEPYRTLIVLQKGTNSPLAVKGDDDLFMKNKWLIAHEDRQDLVDKGAWPGLRGENYDWETLSF